MNALRLKDPKKVLVQQVAALKGYAAKSVFQGESLGPLEEADKAVQITQFFVLGKGFRLTPKEMVVMLMAEHPATKDECGCHSCLSRSSRI